MRPLKKLCPFQYDSLNGTLPCMHSHYFHLYSMQYSSPSSLTLLMVHGYNLFGQNSFNLRGWEAEGRSEESCFWCEGVGRQSMKCRSDFPNKFSQTDALIGLNIIVLVKRPSLTDFGTCQDAIYYEALWKSQRNSFSSLANYGATYFQTTVLLVKRMRRIPCPTPSVKSHLSHLRGKTKRWGNVCWKCVDQLCLLNINCVGTIVKVMSTMMPVHNRV